jgi:tRNA modification GTPase
VREGVALAIVGPPNAGKSSLLNALLGEERAIVAPVAGTTRDVIEERVIVGGVPVRVLDTAGMRSSDDPIERIGVQRAQRALDGAAVALVVIDGARALDADARAILAATRERPRIVFFNKADLGRTGYDGREPAERDAVHGSVADAATLVTLRATIERIGWQSETIDLTRAHLASARHADAVARAREALGVAQATLAGGDALDLIAPPLLAAVAALGEITGAVATEAVLDGVFARFCIGK